MGKNRNIGSETMAAACGNFHHEELLTAAGYCIFLKSREVSDTL